MLRSQCTALLSASSRNYTYTHSERFPQRRQRGDQSSRVKGSFNFTNAFFHLAVVKKPGTYLYLRGNTRSGSWPSWQTDTHPAGTTLKSTDRTEHRPPSQARTPT